MASNLASTPIVMQDNLLHVKSPEGEEVIVFPFTRYENVMGSPKMIVTKDDAPGAPFVLYKTDEVDVPLEELQKLFGNIF